MLLTETRPASAAAPDAAVSDPRRHLVTITPEWLLQPEATQALCAGLTLPDPVRVALAESTDPAGLELEAEFAPDPLTGETVETVRIRSGASAGRSWTRRVYDDGTASDWRAGGRDVESFEDAVGALAMVDEEILDDLAPVLDSETPIEEQVRDATIAEVIVVRLLRTAAACAGEIRHSKAAEARELDMLRASHERRRSLAEAGRTRALLHARAFAHYLGRAFGKKKTLTFPYGSVGFKDTGPALVIDDRAQVTTWAKGALPGVTMGALSVSVAEALDLRGLLLFVPSDASPTVMELARTLDARLEELLEGDAWTVDLNVIKKHAKATGEVIPGTTDVPPAREWFARETAVPELAD